MSVRRQLSRSMPSDGPAAVFSVTCNIYKSNLQCTPSASMYYFLSVQHIHDSRDTSPNLSSRLAINSRCQRFDLLLFRRFGLLLFRHFGSICHRYDCSCCRSDGSIAINRDHSYRRLGFHRFDGSLAIN